MSEFNKYSTDGGATFIDVEDSNAVHYGEQSKGYVGKNLFDYINAANSHYNATHSIITNGVKVKTSTSTKWGNLYYAIPNKYPNTAHKFICDIDYVSGVSKVIIRTDDTLGTSGNIVAESNNFTSDQTDVTLSFTTDTKKYIIVQLFVTAGTATTGESNYTKLLIQLASISDTTYEPSLTPNTDLMSYADNAILGAKNALDGKGTTVTDHEVTFTVNADGTISTSGTATGGRAKMTYTCYCRGIELPKVIGCPQGGGADYWIDLYDYNTSSHNNEYGEGAQSTIHDGDKIDVNINIKEGTNANGLVFFPMLVVPNDSDKTMCEFAYTNQILTNRVKQSVEDVTTTFKNEVVVSGSTITNVEFARKIRYGNIIIFQSRLNKAANTKINQNITCPNTFNETYLENTIGTMCSATHGGTMTFDKSDKKISFRYDNSDGTTYVDMQMILIVAV